jgi:DNA-binding NarL/FixJ family response regulator
VETIRLAFADVPTMLRELVTAPLQRAGGVEVVACALDADDLPRAAAELAVDVLVMGPRGGGPGAMAALLVANPRLRALVVLDEGRRALIYELRPSRELADLSAVSLAAVVAAARRGWEDQLDPDPVLPPGSKLNP